MAMSLSDIEERAQDLIVQLLNAGKNEALLLGIQIEGLRDLAQIKAVGMEAQAWGTTEPDPRNISGLCFAISPLAIGKPPYPCCELMRGHNGAHSDGNTNWTNSAEPTKPAADQLHELLSYLRTHAEEADDKAGHVLAQSPPWTRHKAVYRAYDDAATKLRDILSEGGI